MDEMREYEMSVPVYGYFRVRVKASSFEEAKDLANDATCEADFGALEDIDWDDPRER